MFLVRVGVGVGIRVREKKFINVLSECFGISTLEEPFYPTGILGQSHLKKKNLSPSPTHNYLFQHHLKIIHPFLTVVKYRCYVSILCPKVCFWPFRSVLLVRKSLTPLCSYFSSNSWVNNWRYWVRKAPGSLHLLHGFINIK